MFNQLTNNYGKLVHFILRRDRITILIWIFSIVAMTVVIAPTFQEMYKTKEEMQVVAETMKNPAMVAMVGPGYGLDNYTVGAMMGNMMLLFTAVAVAIMNITLVIRHTRKDEEGGRIEVIRSLPVGRLSNLMSTMIVGVGVNIVLAIVTSAGLAVLGIESITFQGSILYGAALGASGIVFAAITALFVQLSNNARGAMGYSIGIMCLAYLLRAVGDVSNETLACISPLGLILRSEVFVENYWWPILIVLLTAIIIASMAFYLNSKRDLGEGLIPSKPGRKEASTILKTSLGLPLRLLRTSIISWAIGMVILGAAYGSVLGDLESFLGNSEMIKQMIITNTDYSVTEQFMTMLMSIIAMLGTIPVLSFILKIKSEEKHKHSEYILTGMVSRQKYLLSYLIISLISSVIMLFLTFLGLWSGSVATMEEPISLMNFCKLGFVYLPAIWLMVGITVLLIGFFPKWVNYIWVYLGFSFISVYLGKLLKFPNWLTKVSPFGNIPQLPVEDMNVPIFILITSIAVALIIAGCIGYGKRDIQ